MTGVSFLRMAKAMNQNDLEKYKNLSYVMNSDYIFNFDGKDLYNFKVFIN